MVWFYVLQLIWIPFLLHDSWWCIEVNITFDAVERILDAKTVTAAPHMAPACGLYLANVKYDLKTWRQVLSSGFCRWASRLSAVGYQRPESNLWIVHLSDYNFEVSVPGQIRHPNMSFAISSGWSRMMHTVHLVVISNFTVVWSRIICCHLPKPSVACFVHWSLHGDWKPRINFVRQKNSWLHFLLNIMMIHLHVWEKKIAGFILVKFNYPVFKLQLDSPDFFGVHSVELRCKILFLGFLMTTWF